MLLLMSHGLFVGLIIVVLAVVGLCVAFSVTLYLKTIKVKKTLDADNIKKELHRRETEAVIALVKESPDSSKREALINELRRIKSAEVLVDEIIKSEKAEYGIEEHHPVPPRPVPNGQPRPVPNGQPRPVPNGQPRPVPNGQPAPAEKPAEDGNSGNPSET